MKPHVVPGFLTPEECHLLLDCYTRNANRYEHDCNEFWRDRVLHFHKVPERDRGAKLLMARTVMETMEVVKKRWVLDVDGADRSVTLWPETVNLVSWDGRTMPPHVDQANGFEFRKFSAIVYLNDVDGGELYFPKTGHKVKPQVGQLVTFPSGENYPHGVLEYEGTRYTLATWFTDELSKVNWEVVSYSAPST